MSRYATDLKPLFEILCKHKASLRHERPIAIRSIRVYYEHKFNDLQYEVIAVSRSITKAMNEAIKYFEMRGNVVEQSQIDLSNCINIATSLAMDPELREIFSLTKEQRDGLYKSLFESFFKRSNFTTLTLAISLIHNAKKFTPKEKIEIYKEELEKLKNQFLVRFQV